jgi:hypothetical protein
MTDNRRKCQAAATQPAQGIKRGEIERGEPSTTGRTKFALASQPLIQPEKSKIHLPEQDTSR